MLLVSAPYALKAGDAETIGGFPPSAFVLATPAAIGSAASGGTAETVSPLAATDVTTTGGTLNYLPIFSGADTVIDSAVFQTGSGTMGKVGIDTTTPATQLDVNGAGTIRGTLSLPATGVATAGGGKNSQGLNIVASSFSSTSSTALNQVFRWQAEPAGNNTTAPSGTLNLLYGLGATTPSETGLKLNSKGIFTFATGQTFPGVPQLGKDNTFTTSQTVDGTVTATSTAGNGLVGNTSNVTGYGVEGNVTATTGTTAGVYGTTASPTGRGVLGQAKAAGGTGVYGASTNGYGVEGFDSATSGTAVGVLGSTLSPAGIAVIGESGSTASALQAGAGVSGLTVSPTSYGVEGYQYATTGTTAGVLGETYSPAGYGVSGENIATTGTTAGVYGTTSSSTGYGVEGLNSAGIGVYGSGATGVVGVSTSVSGPGGSFTGFFAPLNSGLAGTDGINLTGGNADGNSAENGGAGLMALGGVGGGAGSGAGGPGGAFQGGGGSTGGDGVYSFADFNYAGNFNGDLNVSGAIFAGTKDFKIDHPLDPANKYLVHASVESSEMKNIYDGNVTTDSEGHATVQLPEWFEVLNTDFRYQLTVIGQFAQAIVAREIENDRFEIRTSAPNIKVSWQVTGVRQDAYAKAHPLVVEQGKEARLRGFYIHPELYGAPSERQIEWARHPQIMKRMQELRAKQLATIRAAAQPPTAQSK
jgi:hypothetical protein